MKRKHVTRFRKSNRRWLFLLGLLILGTFLLLSQQPNILPLLTNYTRSLGLSFGKLNLQWLTNKLSTTINKLSPILDSICLWGRGVYEAGIEQSRWLINRWLVLAAIMGLLLPTVVLGLFFVIRGIRDYFEKNAIANKHLSEVVKSIKSKVSKAYRRRILSSWEQVSLIILSLGISLFCLQLLAANLWWWNKGVGFSSLFLFVLYAHWVYYDHLLGQGSAKQRLLGQIDSRLGLKQGLVTLMETKNFNASPRFYKLLLTEVFYKIKQTNFAKILSYKFSWSTKRDLAIPLILILSLSGLVSVAHSRWSFLSGIRNKLEQLFSWNREPEDIEKLLAQEADSLRLLTTELQHNQANQPETAYIMDNLNKLAAELTYLARKPLEINQDNQYGDSQVTETGPSNKPSVKHQPINWDEERINTPQKRRDRPQKPNTPDTMEAMSASIPPDWPEGSPPDEGIIDIPLRASNKYYQAASAEVNKIAQAMLAMKVAGEDVLNREDDKQLTPERSILGMSSWVDDLANGGAGSAAESLGDNKSSTNAPLQENQTRKSLTSQSNQHSNKLKQKDSERGGNPPAKAPMSQPIISALDQIGNQLSNIKLYKAGVEGDQASAKTRPATQSSSQKELVNNIQLKPIKSKAKTEQKPKGTTNGVVVLEHPHHLEIDPPTDQHSSAEAEREQRFPLPDHPPNNLKQKIKVSARRIEELGDRLLMVNNPEHISFNPQKGKIISSLWKEAGASIKGPKNIDNQLPQVTERIKEVDDPRQIAAITSELAELSRKFSAWGRDSGNKLSRLKPDLTQLTETDSLGRKVSKPLPEGGPDKADRQAVIIRGKREQASQHSDGLERIRVEEHPKHLPEHDIVANVSVELNQVANRLENVDVASIKANMSGINLRDFVIEKQRTLEILNDQLARAKDFSSVTQITNKLTDLSAQLGKLALDSLATAEFLANQRAIQEGQKLETDTANSELIDRVSQDGKELLELSQQIKQEVDAKSRADISSQMLALAKGLEKVDFDQIILNDYNELQLKKLLRNLSQQLGKINQHTTDLADVDRNSYAVAAVADRLGKLGIGDIGFTVVAESRDGVDLTRLSRQLSNLSQEMQAAAQATPYQANTPQPERNKELMEGITDGAERLRQIKQRLELAGDQQERAELGLGLLKLSRMLRGTIAENNNDPIRAISTKAIMNIGDQIKQVGKQLRSNPADYQAISARLEQIAGKLEERNQELTAAQLASDQDIAQLPSDLSRLAQRLKEMGPDTLRQQDRAKEQARDQINPDMYQQLISQAGQDLLKISQDLADLSVDYPDSRRVRNYDNPGDGAISEHADQLGRIIDELKGSDSPRQLDQLALESLGRELAQLSQELRQARLELEDGAVSDGLPRIARELAELSLGLTAAGNTDINAASAAGDVDRNAFKEWVKEIKGLNEMIGQKQDPTQLHTMLLELAELVNNHPPLARGLASVSDMRAGELKQRLNQINELRSRLNPELKPPTIKLMGDNMVKLAVELAELDQGGPKQTPTDNSPDTRQLASQLTGIYDELNRLDLARHSSESASTEDLGSRLKQISRSMKELMPTRLEEITSTLDRLGEELLTANISAKGAAPHRHQLKAEKNGMPAGSTADDSRRKREMAVKNIDQVIERLRRQYRKTEGRYDPETSPKGLNLADKGIAKASKGIMDKFNDSPYTKTRFTADKVAKQINVTPEKETVSNAYSMERNLTERDIFRRIIERLEDKRERISHFGALTPVEPTTSRRTGAFNQPQDLDYEGRMLTMTGQESNPIAANQEKKTTFLEKPKSYQHIEDLNPYTYQVPVLPKDVDKAELLNLPLEKQKPKQKIQPNLKLHAQQTQDKASQHQLIPMSYREIIRKLYLY